jgi:flagella basal body P-ring formation protein FlgA
MTGLLSLLIVTCAASTALAQTPARTPAEMPGVSLELRVAEALAAEVRMRMGVDAVVVVGHVDVAVRGNAHGSLGVSIAPDARLEAPVEFGVLAAGASGRAAWMGRGRADVRVMVPHAVAARTINRGTLLTAADVTDVTAAPGPVLLRRLPTAASLVGATVRRDTAGGEVMTAQHVTLPLAVRAGDVVQAWASIGPVQVIGELTAMDSGAEGVIVRVVNRESRREMRARVVRAGVVEVIHE